MHDLIDLTQPLSSGTPVYPGDPHFSCTPFTTVTKDGYSVHSLSLGSHTGTHIDAPSHFVQSGRTIDKIPLSTLIGPALVIRLHPLKPRYRITWEKDLAPYESQMKAGVILLLYTGYSAYRGSPTYFDHPFLDRGAASKILSTGIRVIGVDTLSPDETHTNTSEESEGDFGVHETILGADGVIAENLTNLDKLVDGNYTVSLFPLKIAACDGSPIRAVAWRS